MSDDLMSVFGSTTPAANALSSAGVAADDAKAGAMFGQLLDAELAVPAVAEPSAADTERGFALPAPADGSEPGARVAARSTDEDDEEIPSSRPSALQDPIALAMAMASAVSALPPAPTTSPGERADCPVAKASEPLAAAPLPTPRAPSPTPEASAAPAPASPPTPASPPSPSPPTALRAPLASPEASPAATATAPPPIAAADLFPRTPTPLAPDVDANIEIVTPTDVAPSPGVELDPAPPVWTAADLSRPSSAPTAAPPPAIDPQSAIDQPARTLDAIASSPAALPDPRAALAPRFRVTPRDLARPGPASAKDSPIAARTDVVATSPLLESQSQSQSPPRVADAPLPAPASPAAGPSAPEAPHAARPSNDEAAPAVTIAPRPAASDLDAKPATTDADAKPVAASEPSTASSSSTTSTAGIPPVADGALTIVNPPPAARKPSDPMAASLSDAPSDLRERGRAAAAGAADHRALAAGIHAKVDLGGDAGKILVHAEKSGTSRIDVRLDTDVAHTARALTANAHDLALDLRSEAREARVTVHGPGTQPSVSTSGEGGGAHHGGGRGSHDDNSRSTANSGELSSQRDDRGRDPRAPYAQSEGVEGTDAVSGPRVSRRARFVL